MRNERKQRLLATVIGAGGAFPIAFALSMLWGGCPSVIPTPGPTPTPVVKKGDHLIVMVDDSAPSIPQALVLDGPEARTLKAAGKLDICSITEEWAKRQGYTSVLEEAGGAPATLIITADGDRVHAGRLQTDRKAFATYCEKYLNGAPKFTATRFAAPLAKVINKGGDLTAQVDEQGRPYFQDGEHKRLLTVKAPDPLKLAGLPRYGDHNPVFPISEWYDLDRRPIFGDPDWILDQDGISSCVGNGWAGALRRVRVLAGMKDVKLSPGYAYSLINGNHDNGAVISDGIEALTEHGTCSFETLGQRPFYQSQIKAQAKQEANRFRIGNAYRVTTWEECVSGLLTGRYVLVFGIQVGSQWGKFDQYGVSGHDRGPGNHCIMADGVKKLPDGRVVLDAVNSWTTEFGPWKTGRVYQDKNHLFGNGCQCDGCLIRVATRDPEDKLPPPLRLKAADAEFSIAP